MPFLKKNSMKLLSIAMFCFLAYALFAHGGGTDSHGGHHDRKNGGYHFHHGRSAHQHYEGHCPYDVDDDLLKLSGIGGILVFLFLKARDKVKRA